ncbi:hypothetical protein QCA50_003163 [Cerrena zonata]|uniref:Uncharacterized protein n=1 Tax=Cerrena zonata TaxID=2478898 RepID=A0AAW0GVN8_9APHY
MSRLTAAQVISLGEYLEPTFDPASLTVAQLLGIFGFHNINYPSQYTKAKLIQLFNEEVKPKGNKFKKQRLKRENSIASDDGITDGVTGRPLNEAQPVRRSSRRLSRAPSQTPSEDLERPEPPKRRRSTAEPALGGPSRRRPTKPSQPVLVEESEPEELPVRKVSRNKKSSADAGSQARRVSESRHTEDSGWEDNNIFQSGAESSSPAKPSPVRPRTRRSSAMPPLRSRKSMSAPPDSPSKPKGKSRAKPESHKAPSVKPPESSFEPELPPGVSRETAKRSLRTPVPYRDRKVIEIPDDVEEMTEPGSQSQSQTLEAKLEAPQFNFEEEPVNNDVPIETEAEPEVDHEEADDGSEEQLAEGREQVLAVSKRIADGGQVVRRDSEQELDAPPMPLILRIFIAVLLLTGGSLLFNFKQESAPLGFCETGKSTNAILEVSRARWAAIESCNKANSTLLYPDDMPYVTDSIHSPVPTQTPAQSSNDDMVPEGQLVKSEPCPPLPILPVPHPSSCAKCPPHATCTPSTMTCETGFLIRPHPALIFLRLPISPSPATSNAQQSYSLPYLSDIPDANLSVSQLLYKYISLVLDGIPGVGPGRLFSQMYRRP